MRGVDFLTSVKLFGLRDGFSFWLKWSVADPVEMFIWLNITHKPYCMEHGFGLGNMCGEECTAKKLSKKEDILKEWDRMKGESEEIIQGKNGECAYCGEFKGRVLIGDPNMDSLKRWSVCETCSKVIGEQMNWSMGHVLKNEKMIKGAEGRLKHISAEPFTPAVPIAIKKKNKGD